MKSKFKLVFITFVLTLGLSISAQNLLAAWVVPTTAPPNQNMGKPIDTGGAAQSKDAGLILNHADSMLSASWLNMGAWW